MPTPIALHPDNPHYFLFRGEPTVLITSAEHYGAVINREFDYRQYLDALARYRLNATRIYPGALIERDGDFIAANTLAPRAGQLVLPWARAQEPGFALGGAKFDLDRWDPEYFARLRDFIDQAAERQIVVEICFFNAQYPNNWPIQALHHANNVQGIGRGDHVSFQTLRDPALVGYQRAFVAEIVRQLNDCDNVIFEICDEPLLFGTPADEVHAWISHLIDVVRETEAGLPHRHLIAQQVQGELGGPVDFSADPRVDIIVGQYVWADAVGQLGGLQLLETHYGHTKPIELNETAYYPVWYTEDREAASRVEAWEFVVGGGASFNHLNGIFTTHNPAGEDPNNHKVLSALRHLRDFIEGFAFSRMRRDTRTLLAGPSGDARVQCLSDRDQQWAVYLHHSVNRNNRYVTRPGLHQDTLLLDLPAGTFDVEWHSPEHGTLLARERLIHWGGALALPTQPYRTDIALKLVRVPSESAFG